MKLNAASRLRAREIRARQRTPQEIASLPHFSAAHAEDVFQVGHGLYIDNVNGLGHTPDNQCALYKGFVSVLPCQTFLSLAEHDGSVRARASELLALMRQGYGVGNPYFYLNIDQYVEDQTGHARITGHEGRGRAMAFLLAGIHEIPVQFVFLGYRARRIENRQHFKEYLNANLESETGNLIPNIFSNLIFG